MSDTEYAVIAETFPKIHENVAYFAAKYVDAEAAYERTHSAAELVTKSEAHGFLYGIATTMIALKAISNASEYISAALKKARDRL